MLPLLAGVVMAGESRPPRVVEEIVIVRPQAKPETPTVAVANGQPSPLPRGEIMSRFLTHPDQTFVDSEFGPVPLWQDIVHDSQGNPTPYFPDIFVKQFADNPTPENARIYLAARRARGHRYAVMSQLMRQAAHEMGYISPETFGKQISPIPGSRQIYEQPREGWGKKEYGLPVMSGDQARAIGLNPEEIPYIPGIASATQVEVILIWDWRCEASKRLYIPFARWAKNLSDRQMGIRFMALCADNDGEKIQAHLDTIDYIGNSQLLERGTEGPRGVTHYIENRIDTTGFVMDMKIERTPTVVLVNRTAGRVLRVVGADVMQRLPGMLMDLVGRRAEDYADMDPIWFRNPGTSFGSGIRPPDQTSEPVEGDATLLMEPTMPYATWSPGYGHQVTNPSRRTFP
jgi:hypothetical protein